MSLTYDKLVSTFAFFLLLMADHEKSSNILFEMVEERNQQSSLQEEEDFDDIREFVLDIVEIISVMDPEYSERMARKYYDLVTGLK